MDAMPSADTAKRIPARPAESFELKNFDSFKSSRQYYIIRNPKPERVLPPSERKARTVVVLGSARGGTTMTAGVVRLLGEQFADGLNWYLEDNEIRECFLLLYRSFLFWRIIPLRWHFARIMKNRHHRLKRWAFKSTDMTPFVLLLSGAIPNPYYIIPTRNPLETSFGLSEYIHGGWRTSMLSATFLQLLLTIFGMLTRRPVMLFSYEHVTKTDPGCFVDVLADFLSIDLDDARKRAAIDYIDPGRGYDRAPGIRSCIDRLTRKAIGGWVVDTRQPGRSVTVEVRTGDRILATVRADNKRPDVVAAGFHQTGSCGFNVVFDEPLRDEDLKAINLVDSETGESALTQ